MNYGNQRIDYALRNGMTDVVENYDDYLEAPQPKYVHKRSSKALRKRGKKRSGTTHPGCGIGGRRNRQYSW